jgi:Holliday junction DNA helicase RuvA
MISFIKGEVAKKGLDYLILENNDIGYFINTSLSTLREVNEHDEVCIYTYMHIREDILALYGFLNPEEIDMFKKLISVNGVGPKAGLSVLSTNDITSIKEIILKEDIAGMSKVPGIGKKTASKIILELKDKVGSLDEIDRTGPVVSVDYGKDERSDIIDALVSLGFALFEVKNVIDEIDRSGKTENDIIKEALKKLNRKV